MSGSSPSQGPADATHAPRAAWALPANALSAAVERQLARIGAAASWLWALLIAVVVINVAARYGFGRGSIMLEEVQWHLYAVGFLVGLAYCAVADRHVRVDILAERLPPRARAAIELAGMALFLLPFALVVATYAVPFTWRAWQLGEVSVAPGGLPYRWALKSFIVGAFVLLAAAALARASRCTTALWGWPRALATGAKA